mgnify:CR=1 FL=1
MQELGEDHSQEPAALDAKLQGLVDTRWCLGGWQRYTGGGDFVGRDKNVSVSVGKNLSGNLVTGDNHIVSSGATNTQNIFAPVYTAIQQAILPSQEKEDLTAEVKEIEIAIARVSTLFFMLERPPANQKITIWQKFDMNNNRVFTELEDRLVKVVYDPENNSSAVNETIYTGTNQFFATYANHVDWSESKNEGGKRAEWGIPMALLGMTPGQTSILG